MTLVLKRYLGMVKMYDHTNNEAFMPRHSKVIAQMDRQTWRHCGNSSLHHFGHIGN